MLLRASGEALGDEVDLGATVGSEDAGDAGVPHGAALARFAEAATRGSEDLPDARAALLAAVGPEGFVEAAATVGIFNGLVRVADATGIPLDDGTRKASRSLRSDLGIDRFAGASGTTDATEAAEAREADVGGLFFSS